MARLLDLASHSTSNYTSPPGRPAEPALMSYRNAERNCNRHIGTPAVDIRGLLGGRIDVLHDLHHLQRLITSTRSAGSSSSSPI